MPPRRTLPLAVPLLLGACTTAPVLNPGRPALSPPPPAGSVAMVIGQDAAGLARLFGEPALDIHEGPARKLQYRGPTCVLDAYLYPPAGGGVPKVTWIDARTPRGDDIDRASCIAALAGSGGRR